MRRIKDEPEGAPLWISLSWTELRRAVDVARDRNLFAVKDGLRLERGRTDLGFERHIIGAIGELAVAKHLDVYWSPMIGGLDTLVGDVAGIHVKAVTSAGLSLIVREHDPDDIPYVMAVIELPNVRLAGWIYGKDAKQPEFWRTADAKRGIHRAAFFVPPAQLRSMDCLPAVKGAPAHLRRRW